MSSCLSSSTRKRDVCSGQCWYVTGWPLPVSNGLLPLPPPTAVITNGPAPTARLLEAQARQNPSCRLLKGQVAEQTIGPTRLHTWRQAAWIVKLYKTDRRFRIQKRAHRTENGAVKAGVKAQHSGAPCSPSNAVQFKRNNLPAHENGTRINSYKLYQLDEVTFEMRKASRGVEGRQLKEPNDCLTFIIACKP